MNLPPEEEDGDGKEAFEEEQEEEGKEQETDSPLPDFDFVPVFPCLVACSYLSVYEPTVSFLSVVSGTAVDVPFSPSDSGETVTNCLC